MRKQLFIFYNSAQHTVHRLFGIRINMFYPVQFKQISPNCTSKCTYSNTKQTKRIFYSNFVHCINFWINKYIFPMLSIFFRFFCLHYYCIQHLCLIFLWFLHHTYMILHVQRSSMWNAHETHNNNNSKDMFNIWCNPFISFSIFLHFSFWIGLCHLPTTIMYIVYASWKSSPEVNWRKLQNH